jgi:excisionase family DNA binding protein
MTTGGNDLLTVAEVARSLGVGDRYVYRLVDERRVPFIKLGHYVRFDPAELAAWLDEARVLPTVPTRRR